MLVLHARSGGWLAVIGRAASPSEKTARPEIVSLRSVAVPEDNTFDVSWVTSLTGHELHRFRYPSVNEWRRLIRKNLRCGLCSACAPPAPVAARLGTARPWRGMVPFTHLAREGRMTVTIGRRELLVALGGSGHLCRAGGGHPERSVALYSHDISRRADAECGA